MKLEKPEPVQLTRKKIDESLSYTVEVRDKQGRVIQRVSAPSRSYVQQWNQLSDVAAGTGQNIDDTAEVERWCHATKDEEHLKANAGIGETTFGIRVGKGTTAVAIADYALESPCGEGTGTDQFEHQAVQFTEPSVADSTCSFTISRTMINNSGATITGIREIGCYVVFVTPPTPVYTYYMMGFRDVLPGALSIPDGGSITVTYTISVTV